MSDWYSYIEFIHIISVISWMAALLYIPRLFVYHSMPTTGTASQKIFQIMEKKLIFYIANPAMIFAVITGLTLAIMLGFPQFGMWLHLKLLFVFLMIFYHHYLYYCRRKLIANPQWKTPTFFRILNEIPTILMIFIVFLVVIRPFS